MSEQLLSAILTTAAITWLAYQLGSTISDRYWIKRVDRLIDLCQKQQEMIRQCQDAEDEGEEWKS